MESRKIVLINLFAGLQWASLVAQLVKNLPAMRETWVRFLGWEDPLEEGLATQNKYSSILAWRIPMDRGAWWATVHGVAKSQTRLRDSMAWRAWGWEPGISTL